LGYPDSINKNTFVALNNRKIMARFFSLPKNKRFTFTPRYYDERAEMRKERNEQIKREVEAEREGKKSRFTKEEMAHYIKMTRRTQKKSNMRLLVILALLLAIFYFFLIK
jgi:hypothetical protein